MDDGLTLSSFTDEAVRRGDVGSFLTAITAAEAQTPPLGQPDWSEGYAVVEATLTDGRVEARRVDVVKGEGDLPLSDSELEAKFRSCLEYGRITDPEAPKRLLADMVASTRVSELVAALGAVA
jgi:2-methylcitrate dehydratase PrpD